MINYLMIEKDLDKCSYLLNNISEFDSKLRIHYIALTGKESIKIIKSNDIDFIILDSNITDTSYLDMLDIIEKEKRYENSVIVISDNELEYTKIKEYSCINMIIDDIYDKHILKKYILNIVFDKSEKNEKEVKLDIK